MSEDEISRFTIARLQGLLRPGSNDPARKATERLLDEFDARQCWPPDDCGAATTSENAAAVESAPVVRASGNAREPRAHPATAIPDVPADQRAADDLVKQIRKLRWIGPGN